MKIEKRDNYKQQAEQAKKYFLTYDQQELICRCRLQFDADYFYITFLAEPHRICRTTGHIQRQCKGVWTDANGFAEVMTIFDWLCDSRQDRYITGRWVNVVNQGPVFHTNLQEEKNSDAERFSKNPDAFCAACEAMGGVPVSSGDIGYTIELIDGLCVLVLLWHGDEEFPPRIRCLWDENTTRYIRYETTWYAVGLLMQRIRENMPNSSK